MNNYESLVELNVNKQIDKLFGDKDSKLKFLTKLDLLDDGSQQANKDKQALLNTMKKSNEIEMKFINEEMHLTYDDKGNLVFVSDIELNKSTEKLKIKE
jgi:hypothetical protein